MKTKLLILTVMFWIALNARAFTVTNISSSPSIASPTSFTAARYNWAKELQDVGDLTPFPDPPSYTTLLEVTSAPYGTKLLIDARPKTSITSFILSLELRGKTVTQAENRLQFNVDTTSQADFQYRIIRARQIWPTTGAWYTIPKDGSNYDIQLPDLVNQANGVYAKWEVSVERILPGDIVEDGKVDLQDFARLAAEWMASTSQSQNGGNFLASDIDLSRLTDLEDLLEIVDSWLLPE